MKPQYLPLMLAMLFVACGHPERDTAGMAKPLYFGLAYDVSGSAKKLPALSHDHLNEIISIVKKRGGAVAFGLIENKVTGLDRLPLMPVSGRLDERARHSMKNREAISAWEAHVATSITRPRNAAHSDLNGTIAELARFFSGPEIPANAERVALLITDGIHDAQQNRRSQVQLPQGVKVLVVGIDAARAKKIFAGRVFFFASIEAALESLQATREE